MTRKKPQRQRGMAHAQALPAARVEALLHGAPLPDLQRHAARAALPPSPAVAEALDLMARAAVQAKAPPTEQLSFPISSPIPKPTMNAIASSVAPPPTVRKFLDRVEIRQLEDWVKAKDVTQFRTVIALTEAALKETGLDLTQAHVRRALDTCKISHFKRPAKPMPPEQPAAEITAMELSVATAKAMADLFALAGANPSPAFAQALARAGISSRPAVPV